MSSPLRTAFLLGALFLAYGCTSNDPVQLMAAARDHQDKGDHAAAIVELRNVIAADPKHLEARRMLAVSYNARNQPVAAEDEIRKAIDQGADPHSLRPILARALLFQGKNERLLQEILPDANATPTDALSISEARGLAHLAMGNFNEAKALLDRVVAQQPNSPDAMLGLAGIALAENKAPEAFERVAKAIALNPKNIDAWVMKGNLSRMIKQVDDASAAFLQVLTLDPDNVSAHMQLTSLYIDAERFDDASRHLDAARSKGRDSALASYLFALIEFRKNNVDVARRAIAETLKNHPHHTPSLLLAGAIEYASGSFDTAASRLRTLLERAPGSLLARRMLAVSLIQGGQIQRAIELLDQSLAMAPDDVNLLALMGEAHLQNSDIPRAVPYLERASKVDPKNESATTSLQVARILGGQSGRALADLEQSMKVESGVSSRLELLYVATLVHRGNLDAASKAIPVVEKSQPNNPVMHNLKAAIQIGKGDAAGARKSLETALGLNPRFTPAVINLAKLDVREKNPRQARQRIEALLERQPANATALTALGEMATPLGVTNSLFIEYLERARRANPSSTSTLALLSRAHLRAGDAEKALQLADEAQRRNPDNAEILDVLAAAQMAAGRPADALGTYSKLALQDPKSAPSLYLLANAQLANNNTAGATITLRKALGIDPAFPPALLLLGSIELGAGRLPNATRIAQELQQRFPGLAAAYVLEADALRKLNQGEKALALYRTALQRGDRSASTAIKTHMTMIDLGRRAEADAMLMQFAQANPNEASVHAYLADAHLSAGRFDAAADYYQRVLAQQPDSPLVLNNLAWASYKLKDSRARQYAEKAHTLAPDNPLVLDTYGWILAETGEVDRGAELLQRAVTRAPEARQIRFHLAQVLIKTGNYPRARRELEVVLAASGPFDHEEAARKLMNKLR